MDSVPILYVIWIGLLPLGGVYAVFLHYTELGKWLCRERTWLTVVLGTTYVLVACLIFMSLDVWAKLFLTFVVASIPILIYEVYDEFKSYRKLVNYYDQRGQDRREE